MTDDSYESQLPDDLNSIARELRENRTTADGEVLERALGRARKRAGAPRRRVSPNAWIGVVLALALVIGVKLSNVDVASAIASLTSGVTNPVSYSPNGSAAGHVYCGPGSGSGSSGWAPTFRWHFGYPSPDVQGADDGWSPSVQPDCPGGTLSIRLSDTFTIQPGNSIQLGYDFHQANKPAFTLNAYNPSVVFSYKCGNGSTMSFGPAGESWTGGTYTVPANEPNWIPTGTKTDASGFQGSVTIPALCGAGKPITLTGGTFSALIKIT